MDFFAPEKIFAVAMMAIQATIAVMVFLFKLPTVELHATLQGEVEVLPTADAAIVLDRLPVAGRRREHGYGSAVEGGAHFDGACAT